MCNVLFPREIVLCFCYRFKDKVKIIHFIGHRKPWIQPFDKVSNQVRPLTDSEGCQTFLQTWWDIYPNFDPELVGLAVLLVFKDEFFSIYYSNSTLRSDTVFII